jgi:hypothetical protein
MKYVDQIVGGVIYSLRTGGGGVILSLKRSAFTFNMGRVLKSIN